MAFVVSKSKVSEALADPENLFEFQPEEDGPAFTLPKMGFLPRASTKFIRDSVKEIHTFELFRQLVRLNTPEAFELVDGMEDDQVAQLSEAWVVASGAKPESDAGEAESEPVTGS